METHPVEIFRFRSYELITLSTGLSPRSTPSELTPKGRWFSRSPASIISRTPVGWSKPI